MEQKYGRITLHMKGSGRMGLFMEKGSYITNMAHIQEILSIIKHVAKVYTLVKVV